LLGINIKQVNKSMKNYGMYFVTQGGKIVNTQSGEHNSNLWKLPPHIPPHI
jgi:hypothetical protein